MEIEVLQEKMARALSVVSRVAMGAKSTLPILSNVLIKVEGKKVSLTSTNLDMAVVDFIPVVDAKDGIITVPARLLAEFVQNLPKGEKIKLSTEGSKVKVSAGKYSSTINGTDASDFPELPEIDDGKAVIFKMGVDEFKAGASEVVVAASGDTTRPALTGVYFNTDKGSLYIAATDGYRLAEKKFIENVKSEVAAIVPNASIQEVLHSIPDDVDEIEILFDDTQVRFRLGELEITSKLIEGTFPNYRQLIPSKSDILVILDREELTRVVKIAALFARESNRAICCTTDNKKGKFIVSSISNEIGENESEIETKVDESGSVKLDSRFLMDALNALDEEKVVVGFSKDVSPVLIKNEKSDKYRHIIMPLNN
ncbi:DNA polymerase III subunit beta [Candidatus Saccharibacteria bacterium]|nr:DNA polymerase III subunit beta [Candidatus Saccharibacteria bacterium]